MVTRRQFLQGAAALTLLGGLDPRGTLAAPRAPGGAGAAASRGLAKNAVSQFVDVFVGTGGHGHTYPGPTLPWGMVQLSPDTNNYGWDACSGYHQADGSIMGFSHTHLSGTGIGDMLDILLTPGDGRASSFSHADEVSAPGYYSVALKEPGVRAELSATERAGSITAST